MKPVRTIIILVFLLAAVAAAFFLMGESAPTDVPTVLQSVDRERVSGTAEGYVALSESETPRAALQELYTDSETDALTQSQCHEVAHEIGWSAYEAYDGFEGAMQFQNVTCNGGYIHGVLEAAFSDGQNTEHLLQNACANADVDAFTKWQCMHGLGHGVMFATEHDIEATRAACNTLSDRDDAASCLNGAYMQYFTLPFRSKNDDELLELCAETPVPERYDCYLYAPTAYLERHEDDFSGAFEWCGAAPTKNKYFCTGGVMAEATKRNIANTAALKRLCEQFPGIQTATESYTQDSCVRSVVEMFINHHADVAPAHELCAGWTGKEEQCKSAIEQHKLSDA